jgi:hypothetical protein
VQLSPDLGSPWTWPARLLHRHRLASASSKLTGIWRELPANNFTLAFTTRFVLFILTWDIVSRPRARAPMVIL